MPTVGKLEHPASLSSEHGGPLMSTVATTETERQTRFLKVPEVAQLMGVPESTVYDLVRQKRIVGIVRFGRHIRFDRGKFESWLEQGGEGRAA